MSRGSQHTSHRRMSSDICTQIFEQAAASSIAMFRACVGSPGNRRYHSTTHRRPRLSPYESSATAAASRDCESRYLAERSSLYYLGCALVHVRSTLSHADVPTAASCTKAPADAVSHVVDVVCTHQVGRMPYGEKSFSFAATDAGRFFDITCIGAASGCTRLASNVWPAYGEEVVGDRPRCLP